MLCSCAASDDGEQMLMFVRDAIMQDVHVVWAWLNCGQATAANICLRKSDSFVSRLGQWLG